MTLPPAALRFGRFELHVHERRLLVDGLPAPLGARAFDLLLALAERPGALVGKHVLMERVWPGLVVQENNIAAQVSALRKVLGGDVIATIPGRGYRFTARIEAGTPAAAPPPGAPPQAEAPAGAPPQAEAPAGAAPHPALRTNLPAELPPLLGRADDVAALGTLIDRHRLVSIVGAGGIGKSLLAQHLLAARRTAYPHGVCWVELGSVTDAAALPGVIVSALGVDGGRGEPLAALTAAVAPLTMLVALDNAEHLLADVAQVCRALHDAAPGLRLVVTSQAPLKLPVERVVRIGPLAVPQGVLPAAQALAFGAVALFAERALAIDARFQLTDANVPAVIEVCRALDGLALAIELAAVRAPMLGVQRLAAWMQERLRLLTTSRNPAAPQRQQTLRAALQWSHGFLDVREQAVFRRLGVMAGSAALEQIQQVAADADLDAWAVLDVLGGLVDRSLVAVVDAEDDAAPRYRLLDSTRAYALEQLAASGELQAVQRRHALAMAALFDAEYDECFGGRVGIDRWMRRVGADLDNARDALAWARQAGDAATEVAIAATLLRALPPSLHAERMALADACEPRLGPPVPERLQQRGWLELSNAWADTQKKRSRDAAQRALALARALDRPAGDRFPLYLALCRTASACMQAGDAAAALPPLAELQALEDPGWPAQRLLWGAEAAQVIARMRGETADVLRRSRRLVALDRARGSNASIALGNLIDHELAAGDARAAAATGAALVAALEGSRDEYSLAFARINLCAAQLAQNDVPAARAVAYAAWPQAMRFELQHICAAYLALLAALESRPHAAARLLGYAEAIYTARDETREGNEAAALARARTLAVAALGAAAVERASAEGAALRDAHIEALAFGTADD
jgi:predicted ATPase/DNA-binding winged helix-turn-helix (wHTH) protein